MSTSGVEMSRIADERRAEMRRIFDLLRSLLEQGRSLDRRQLIASIDDIEQAVNGLFDVIDRLGG